MRFNAISGMIDHRILLNYRIHPEVLRKVLPAGFEPKLVNGWGIGGICQVSLQGMRPQGLPACLGFSSHNAAHRIAVMRNDGAVLREGVYVPRRDTCSRINQLAGGRIFPGRYTNAHFEVRSQGDTYDVAIANYDGENIMRVVGRVVDAWSTDSVFHGIGEVSDFFRAGGLGWSPSKKSGSYDAIELTTVDWNMEPLEVMHASSSFFGNTNRFPEGSVEFDSAGIMRKLKHSWIAREPLCVTC